MISEMELSGLMTYGFFQASKKVSGYVNSNLKDCSPSTVIVTTAIITFVALTALEHLLPADSPKAKSLRD